MVMLAKPHPTPLQVLGQAMISTTEKYAHLSTGVVYSAKLFSDSLSHRPVARSIAWLVTLPSAGALSTDRAPDTAFGGSL